MPRPRYFEIKARRPPVDGHTGPEDHTGRQRRDAVLRRQYDQIFQRYMRTEPGTPEARELLAELRAFSGRA